MDCLAATQRRLLASARRRSPAVPAAAGGERVADVGLELRRTMQAHCGVFRFPELLAEGVAKMKVIAERAARVSIDDQSRVFNTARIEALIADNPTWTENDVQWKLIEERPKATSAGMAGGR
mgnify:CR=1 FL=1